jgi:NAD(P)-dependent dehydrogenase (short-subunit alcohol dehydrogenase family)
MSALTGSAAPAYDLSGQTALVTGGATGLGLGMARCLLAAGAKVVLVGRRVTELENACSALGAEAFALPGDVTRLDSAAGLVDRAEAVAGPITLLVNNAGVHLKKPALETTDAEFSSILQTHVFGAFALTRETGRRMILRRSGCVVFVASMTAFIGMPLVVAYSAAKSACVGVMRSLCSEWGPHGVRVNAIAPGWIASPMLDQALNSDPARRDRILGRTALGRFGEPDDVGWAVVYLASPAAKFVSGVILPVDGGAAAGF